VWVIDPHALCFVRFSSLIRSQLNYPIRGSTSVPNAIDLHTHTTASDGTLTPEKLVQVAASRDLNYLGIADHDTTNGLPGALAEAGRWPELTVIPAVELSATSSHGGDFHLLGYCIDATSGPLQEQLDEFRRDRESRVERIVERLRNAGVDISLDQVESNAAGGAISRAHIGRVLIEQGEVETINEAFDRWLGRNRPGFVPRRPLFAQDAVRLVRESGGFAVLAHPLTMGDYRKQLPELIDAGLAGIEAHYGPYSPEARSMLADLALKHDLIATGGSDYHGPDHREGRDLGNVQVPERVLDDLRKLAPDCL
jgi:3',5'-nucleoside bisphosphate phosphatase